MSRYFVGVFFLLWFYSISGDVFIGCFFSFRLTSNHDWLWTDATTKTKKNLYELNKSLFFSLEMNYLQAYIFWQSLIYKREKRIKIKIPENGRPYTFYPPSYQLFPFIPYGGFVSFRFVSFLLVFGSFCSISFIKLYRYLYLLLLAIINNKLSDYR